MFIVCFLPFTKHLHDPEICIESKHCLSMGKLFYNLSIPKAINFHDGVILIQLPESFSLLFSLAN